MSSDEEGFYGPDAFLSGDDSPEVLELEFENTPGSRATVAQMLHRMSGLGPLQPVDIGYREALDRDRGELLTLSDIVRLMNGIGSMSTTSEQDDDYIPLGTARPTSWHEVWVPPHEQPQPSGVRLLTSGEFGRLDTYLKARKGRGNISRALLDRSSRRNGIQREELAGNMVPNTIGTAVALSPSNHYVGQFSKESSLYYTCSQDFKLHVYDMTAPPTKPNIPRQASSRINALRWNETGGENVTTMKVIKTIQGQLGRWTITDSHLSPDNQSLIYSSITPIVYLASTLDSSTEQIPIRFSDEPRWRNRSVLDTYDEYEFGVWSCKFSADGNEVIAGGSGHVFVYNLPAEKRTVKIVAHKDDVNSCCWADSAGNVLVSASDDTFVKVWDRRSLGASQKPSGVLVGHTEGITHVSAKEDGRYIISNGKDQALRLWDLRKMHSSDDFDRFSHRTYRIRGYDYRSGHYPRPNYAAHPKDCSVMTYRGHAVLKTLIRCDFSPTETTGGKYIYSGSADGRIHIWSLDGRIIQILDRCQTYPMSADPNVPESSPGLHSVACVRDVSWSSTEPVLMSVGWESGRIGGSVVARHEWKGLSRMGASLEDWNEKQTAEHIEGAARRARSVSRPQ